MGHRPHGHQRAHGKKDGYKSDLIHACHNRTVVIDAHLGERENKQVDVVNAHGLRLRTDDGERTVRVAASVDCAGMSPVDLVIVLVKSFDTRRAIEAALRAPPDGRPETVESLGGGWVAEEALAIALYAGRVTRDFEHGLRIAVTHSGDSDSTAAIAGNLLGLLFPDEVMAHDWRRQVECADLIDRIAGDLHRAGRGGGNDGDGLAESYPGW